MAQNLRLIGAMNMQILTGPKIDLLKTFVKAYNQKLISFLPYFIHCLQDWLFKNEEKSVALFQKEILKTSNIAFL